MASDIGARADIVLALEWLRCKDPLERELLTEVANKMMEKKAILDKNQAVEIANQVGKLFKT